MRGRNRHESCERRAAAVAGLKEPELALEIGCILPIEHWIDRIPSRSGMATRARGNVAFRYAGFGDAPALFEHVRRGRALPARDRRQSGVVTRQPLDLLGLDPRRREHHEAAWAMSQREGLQAGAQVSLFLAREHGHQLAARAAVQLVTACAIVEQPGL